jgi:hypothetical protein
VCLLHTNALFQPFLSQHAACTQAASAANYRLPYKMNCVSGASFDSVLEYIARKQLVRWASRDDCKYYGYSSTTERCELAEASPSQLPTGGWTYKAYKAVLLIMRRYKVAKHAACMLQHQHMFETSRKLSSSNLLQPPNAAAQLPGQYLCNCYSQSVHSVTCKTV